MHAHGYTLAHALGFQISVVAAAGCWRTDVLVLGSLFLVFFPFFFSQIGMFGAGVALWYPVADVLGCVCVCVCVCVCCMFGAGVAL